MTSKISFHHRPNQLGVYRNQFSIHHRYFDSEKRSDCISWCEERFGPYELGGRWMLRVLPYGTLNFDFRDDLDAFEFKMNWY